MQSVLEYACVLGAITAFVSFFAAAAYYSNQDEDFLVFLTVAGSVIALFAGLGLLIVRNI